MSKNDWEPYNVKAITRSFQLVFEQHDIDLLTKPAYKFATLYLNFIAHYNHEGFKSTYRHNLKEFAGNIARYSDNIARYKKDSWYANEYGQRYCDSIYEIGTAVIRMAQANLDIIGAQQYLNEQEAARTTIDKLKKKYDL